MCDSGNAAPECLTPNTSAWAEGHKTSLTFGGRGGTQPFRHLLRLLNALEMVLLVEFVISFRISELLFIFSLFVFAKETAVK